MELEESKVTEPQTLIADTQHELKMYLRDAVLKGEPFEAVQKEVNRIIVKCVKGLDNVDLIAEVSTAFPAFASRLYVRYQQAFGGYTPKQIEAIAAIAQGQKLTPQMQQAIIKRTPIYITNATPDIGYTEKGGVRLPDTAFNRATPLYTYYKDVHREIVQKMNEIAAMDAKPDYATNVSLRNIAEMTVRYEAQMQMLDDLKASGTRLVWIEPHANCSKRCEPWQGKLYSLDGTSGKIDGFTYEPLEVAMNQHYTTRAGKVYRNGCISGYNCRHKLTPYSRGNKPIEIPAAVVERQRVLEQKQRQFERAIRFQRERSQLFRGIDNRIAAASYKKAAALRKEYIEFSRKNKIPFVEERLRVLKI